MTSNSVTFSPHENKSPLKSRQNVFLLMCIVGFFALLSSVMSKNPVLKLYVNYLNTPSEWIGFIASVSSIPGIIASLPVASLSDIFGRRKVLLFSGIIFATAPLCYLLVTTWWQLILVRFYHGFATAVFVPTSEAFIAELFPNKKGARISLLSSATAVGRAIAPIFGGFILSLAPNNFQNLYLIDSIIGITALVLVILFLFGRQNKNQKLFPIPFSSSSLYISQILRKMAQGWAIVIKNRSVLIVSLIQASQYYVFGALEYFLTGYLIEIVKMDIILIGIIQTSMIVMLIVMKPVMGRLGDKFGRRIPIFLGLIIMVVPLLVIPFITGFIPILITVIIYGCGFATVTAQTSPFVSELISKDLVGTSMGFISTWMDIGQTLGTFITGLVIASLTYLGGFISLTGIIFIVGLIFFCSNVGKKMIVYENEN